MTEQPTAYQHRKYQHTQEDKERIHPDQINLLQRE